jgi:DNA-binding NarL/FixJ family response regulator
LWAAGSSTGVERAVDLALAPVPRDSPKRRHSRWGASGLTRRESEVAALIAQGLSNREIADRLVVSERTAEWHVARILDKLGMTTRAQIAVWADRHQAAVDTRTTTGLY